MKNVVSVLVVVLASAYSVFAFQNCSQQGTSFSSDASTQDTGPGPSPGPSPSPNPLPPPSPGSIDVTTCFAYYFTLFPWTNANALGTNAEQVPTVELGATKIATFKIYENAAPTAMPVTGVSWQLSAFIEGTPPNTKTTVNLPKTSAVSDDRLDCYFAPGSTPFAYLNVGLSNTPQNLVGYIGSSTKYIACRIYSGSGKVRVKGADGAVLDLDASQPFVIRRGCYQ